jgi:hypothetical protein
VKGLTGCTIKRGALCGLRNARRVQFCFPRQDGGAGAFKNRASRRMTVIGRMMSRYLVRS